MNIEVETLLNYEKCHFEVIQSNNGQDVNANHKRCGYFKICLVIGHIKALTSNSYLEFENGVLFFADPYTVEQLNLIGNTENIYFCLFDDLFLNHYRSLRDFPVFKANHCQFVGLNQELLAKIKKVFVNMVHESESDFVFKYDVIRNLILELIYFGTKSCPLENTQSNTSYASQKIVDQFIQLLEGQFPIESVDQQLKLRFPIDFSQQLCIHVNHLNRVLKEMTGKTTSQYISERLMLEAKYLLRCTDWSISEIASCLGFDEPPHFINFFKKINNITPRRFRIKSN